MGKCTTLTCSKSPRAVLWFVQCGASPVTLSAFSLGMRAVSHREVRSSFGLHHQLPPWLPLPPRQQGLGPALLPVPHSLEPPGSQSHTQLPGPPEQPIHSQCQVSPLFSSVTIILASFHNPVHKENLGQSSSTQNAFRFHSEQK